MPGAVALGDELDDASVLGDEIVRRNFGGRVDEQRERGVRRRHAGVVEDERVRPAVPPPLAEIRRRDELGGERAVGSGHRPVHGDVSPPGTSPATLDPSAG